MRAGLLQSRAADPRAADATPASRLESRRRARTPTRNPGSGREIENRGYPGSTLFGSAAQVREGIEAWYDAGIKTPIIVPSSVNGGQFQAFDEFFAIWR